MINVSSGDSLPLSTFVVDDVVYLPDDGTVSVNIIGPDAVNIHSADVSFDADYGVPQGLLEVSSGQVLSFFKLRVTFKSEGRVRQFSDIIQVYYPFMYLKDASDVQNCLGVYEEEMPHSEFNLPESFYELSEELGLTVLESNDLIKVNNLIVLHEAVRKLPALELRILKTNELDDAKKSRLSNLDIPKIKTAIQSQYWAIRSSLDGVPDLPVDPLVSFGARTDPVTGA